MSAKIKEYLKIIEDCSKRLQNLNLSLLETVQLFKTLDDALACAVAELNKIKIYEIEVDNLEIDIEGCFFGERYIKMKHHDNINAFIKTLIGKKRYLGVVVGEEHAKQISILHVVSMKDFLKFNDVNKFREAVKYARLYTYNNNNELFCQMLYI